MPTETSAHPKPGPARPKAVVLLSGGLDSATALAVAVAEGMEPICLTIDYGQRHRHELAAAAAVAAHAGAREALTLALDLRLIGGSALTSSTPVPKDRPPAPTPPAPTPPASTPPAPADAATGGTPPHAGEVPVTYVPARNLIFLSIATALAEARGARAIYVGVNAVDYSGYPDCRPAFIAAFQRAADAGTKVGTEAGGGLAGGGAPRVLAPLIGLSKPAIISLGASLGVPFHLTHSCYDPVGPRALACGRCDSCVIRRRGFADAGVPDPTPYAPVGAVG